MIEFLIGIGIDLIGNAIRALRRLATLVVVAGEFVLLGKHTPFDELLSVIVMVASAVSMCARVCVIDQSTVCVCVCVLHTDTMA
jgi:hypothetical protein